MVSKLINRVIEMGHPPPMLVFTFVMVSYFIVTAGIAYDIINEPPAIGGVPDPRTGRYKPQAFMPYRINGQYIMEGLCGGFFYTLGGAGLILLDKALEKTTDRTYRNLFRMLGAAGFLLSYMTCGAFLRIKMPGYLVPSRH